MSRVFLLAMSLLFSSFAFGANLQMDVIDELRCWSDDGSYDFKLKDLQNALDGHGSALIIVKNELDITPRGLRGVYSLEAEFADQYEFQLIFPQAKGKLLIYNNPQETVGAINFLVNGEKSQVELKCNGGEYLYK